MTPRGPALRIEGGGREQLQYGLNHAHALRPLLLCSDAGRAPRGGERVDGAPGVTTLRLAAPSITRVTIPAGWRVCSIETKSEGPRPQKNGRHRRSPWRRWVPKREARAQTVGCRRSRIAGRESSWAGARRLLRAQVPGRTEELFACTQWAILAKLDAGMADPGIYGQYGLHQPWCSTNLGAPRLAQGL